MGAGSGAVGLTPDGTVYGNASIVKLYVKDSCPMEVSSVSWNTKVADVAAVTLDGVPTKRGGDGATVSTHHRTVISASAFPAASRA